MSFYKCFTFSLFIILWISTLLRIICMFMELCYEKKKIAKMQQQLQNSVGKQVILTYLFLGNYCSDFNWLFFLCYLYFDLFSFFFSGKLILI